MAGHTYSSKIRLATALAFAGAVGAGFVAGKVARAGAPGEHFWIVFPALLVVCALAFAACIPWWRRLDDMHRTGHLVCWYWGSIGGLAVALMALIAATGVHSKMTLGAMYLVIGEAVAFLLLWAVWQLRHRGPAA